MTLFQDLGQPGARMGLEVNRCAALVDMASGALGEVHDADDILSCVSSLPWGAFNVVGHCDLREDEVDERIARMQAYYQERERGVVWWSTPYTRPASLVDKLLGHGFVHRASFPGMAADLRRLPPAEELKVPPGTRIERAADPGAMGQFVHTCIVGFGEHLDIVPPATTLFNDLAIEENGNWHCYLATVDGVPASSAAVLLAGGVAGIYWVGTPPEFRRMGLGTAVTAAALRHAYGLGYRVACLTASKLGWPIYTKLGFEDYAEFHTYRWPG